MDWPIKNYKHGICFWFWIKRSRFIYLNNIMGDLHWIDEEGIWFVGEISSDDFLEREI